MSIRQRTRKLVDYCHYVSPAFLGITMMGILDERRRRIFGGPYCRAIYALKDRMFQSFLYKRFGGWIEGWRNSPESAEAFANPKEATIWVCWLQGEAAMPEFVKEMVDNIKKNANGHPVVVTSIDNIHEYADIDDKYIQLYKCGKIAAAHLSDIFRINLLASNGGLWLDVSVFLTRPVPDCIFNRPMWNAKGLDSHFVLEPKCIDITIWESYFLAAQKNSLLMRFMKAFIDEYFIHYNVILDYLWINHFAKIARENIKVISQEFCQIPNNNQSCELLDGALQGLNNENVSDLVRNSETYVYKLSTRAPYAEVQENGHSFAWNEFIKIWKEDNHG